MAHLTSKPASPDLTTSDPVVHPNGRPAARSAVARPPVARPIARIGFDVCSGPSLSRAERLAAPSSLAWNPAKAPTAPATPRDTQDLAQHLARPEAAE